MGRAANILIVEDDVDILQSLAEAITLNGARVRTAMNGEEALAEVDREKFDAIFLDLMMPVMDGWQFVGHLRERPADRQPPIVVVSAVNDIADASKGLGAVGFLRKPFALDDILAWVERLSP